VPWTLALENLRDGDGNQISPEAHATCAGRAVTITCEWDWAPSPGSRLAGLGRSSAATSQIAACRCMSPENALKGAKHAALTQNCDRTIAGLPAWPPGLGCSRSPPPRCPSRRPAPARRRSPPTTPG
jgi:hypothetical protein